MPSTRILSLAAATVLLLLLLTGCGSAAPGSDPHSSQSTDSTAPSAEPTPELRGVWLSFLDLEPLLADADPTVAARRLDAALDTCKNAGLNTVFFHARSHSDAWYASTVFPTAKAAASLLNQGFDPLGYAVTAAHARGLQLHAWINPYRIGTDPANAVVSGADKCFEKGGVWYYNPASNTVRQRVLAGVREILEGYAVDGIHFDDYFYPEGMAEQGEPFETIPDGMTPTAWRQTQVDMLVSAVYGLAQRHHRVFGVSPMAAIDRCATVACADVARWMATPGYIDYICPQLYYGFEHETQAFDSVLQRWLSLPRHSGVTLYGGLALYKVGLAEDTYAGSGRQEWAQHSDILARQVTALRQTRDVGGFVLFRYQQLLDNTPALSAERKALLELCK